MAKIFVFGSNIAGIHGAGAAKYAMQKHGAIYGLGEGIQGDSYAIPTKDARFRTLNLAAIKSYVNAFIAYAQENSEDIFMVTRIGCGLAGYDDKDIAPMFDGVPSNVILPKAWGGTGYDW